MPQLDAEALRSLQARFLSVKKLGDDALQQLPDELLTYSIGDETNCIAVIIKHMRGNMLSRWSNFLTSDGEKANRNRDDEFELGAAVAASEVRGWWEEGWKVVLDSISALHPADLQKTVFIRGEPHSVVDAAHRQLAHYAYHMGQIVLLARHLCESRAGRSWRTLSIKKGGSLEYNKRMGYDSKS